MRNVLVHVDRSRACASRVDVALLLREAAPLTGFYAVPAAGLPLYADGAAYGPMLTQIYEEVEADTRDTETRFKERVTRAGATAVWEMTRGRLLEELPLAARYADLVVVGRRDPDDPKCVSAGVAEAVLFGGGRPVLVVPPNTVPPTVGKQAFVAWNASAEAARAVHDALPLLAAADRVVVLGVDEGQGLETVERLCRVLGRCGVAAEARHCASELFDDAGGAILNEVERGGGDLLVMGGYGHTRLREFVLGGATRTVLHEAPMPVLMSH